VLFLKNTSVVSPSRRLSVEAALKRVVRGIGGSVLDDQKKDRNNQPENADFVFEQYRVVAELKILKKSQRESADMIAKLQVLHQKLLRNGIRVPVINGRAQLSARKLPLEYANELISLYREPIAGRIRKANRQIRSTKETLNMQDARACFFSPWTETIPVDLVMYLTSWRDA